MRRFAVAVAVAFLLSVAAWGQVAPVPGHFFFNLNIGACTTDCSGGGWINGQEFDPSLTGNDTNSADYESGFICPGCIDPDIELDLGDASVPFIESNRFFANSSGGGFGGAIGADYQNDSGETFVDIFLKIPGFALGEAYRCTLGTGFGSDAFCGFKVDSGDSTILDVAFFNVDIPTVAGVPEPAALPLIGLALLGIGGLARRKVWNAK